MPHERDTRFFFGENDRIHEVKEWTEPRRANVVVDTDGNLNESTGLSSGRSGVRIGSVGAQSENVLETDGFAVIRWGQIDGEPEFELIGLAFTWGKNEVDGNNAWWGGKGGHTTTLHGTFLCILHGGPCATMLLRATTKRTTEVAFPSGLAGFLLRGLTKITAAKCPRGSRDGVRGGVGPGQIAVGQPSLEVLKVARFDEAFVDLDGACDLCERPKNLFASGRKRVWRGIDGTMAGTPGDGGSSLGLGPVGDRLSEDAFHSIISTHSVEAGGTVAFGVHAHPRSRRGRSRGGGGGRRIELEGFG